MPLRVEHAALFCLIHLGNRISDIQITVTLVLFRGFAGKWTLGVSHLKLVLASEISRLFHRRLPLQIALDALLYTYCIIPLGG